MKFESYPHDTQICSMMIESRTYRSLKYDVEVCSYKLLLTVNFNFNVVKQMSK